MCFEYSSMYGLLDCGVFQSGGDNLLRSVSSNDYRFDHWRWWRRRCFFVVRRFSGWHWQRTLVTLLPTICHFIDGTLGDLQPFGGVFYGEYFRIR
jgi:hypothetical protein